MLAPLRGPSFCKGHAAPQVPEEHGVRVAFADVVLEIVVVNAVTEQPWVVTVVEGEQVVVVTVEPRVVKVVGLQRTVICNAVSVEAHEDVELVVERFVDEPDCFELLSDLL